MPIQLVKATKMLSACDCDSEIKRKEFRNSGELKDVSVPRQLDHSIALSMDVPELPQ